jgi:hypothetical protein
MPSMLLYVSPCASPVLRQALARSTTTPEAAPE